MIGIVLIEKEYGNLNRMMTKRQMSKNRCKYITFLLNATPFHKKILDFNFWSLFHKISRPWIRDML